MPAILFGSISTIVDTSELQRHAFNQAFETHGLDWTWDRDEYVSMLDESGGEKRIADYAKSRDETVDAGAVHQTKSELFQKNLNDAGATPRLGVSDTIRRAKADGCKVALVTTTSPENVSSLLGSVGSDLDADAFDLVVDATHVDSPKPDGAAYLYALDNLGVGAGECIAIEDNLGGVEAATAAGVDCVAFPNQNTAGREFGATVEVIERVDYERLSDLATAGVAK